MPYKFFDTWIESWYSDNTSKEATMSDSYIGQKECGCLVMAVVNNPDHRREVAREVSRAIRGGLQVSIVPTEQVRTMAWECETHKKGAECPF